MSKITFDYTRKGKVGTLTDIRGKVLIGVSVSGTEATIEHDLGYVPIGYIIMNKSANVDIWETTAATKKNIYLTASGSATINLLII